MMHDYVRKIKSFDKSEARFKIVKRYNCTIIRRKHVRPYNLLVNLFIKTVRD